jgi:hypothetical protein
LPAYLPAKRRTSFKPSVATSFWNPVAVTYGQCVPPHSFCFAIAQAKGGLAALFARARVGSTGVRRKKRAIYDIDHAARGFCVLG